MFIELIPCEDCAEGKKQTAIERKEEITKRICLKIQTEGDCSSSINKYALAFVLRLF